MSYYRMLCLDCEPFSTSPDPAFFYLSRVHRAALFRLRVALELKRGLSVVAGDIGTGKTTLARRLSQILYEDPRVDFHPILNPMHHDDEEFLKTLMTSFGLSAGPSPSGSIDCLHAIEKYLFRKGLEEGKITVLLIDEAQQLSRRALEILRALLNYETNEFKLLQVILVGQMELLPRLYEVPNFWDRICLKLVIPPLDEKETREMIDYRLRQAAYRGTHPLFTSEAQRMIYGAAKGYPRRVTMICHDALEYLVMMNKNQVDGRVVREISRNQRVVLSGALV